MKFPKQYKPPKLESLAGKAGVAWGGDCPGGSSPGGVNCGYNGEAAAICADWGIGAGVCGVTGSATLT